MSWLCGGGGRRCAVPLANSTLQLPAALHVCVAQSGGPQDIPTPAQTPSISQEPTSSAPPPVFHCFAIALFCRSVWSGLVWLFCSATCTVADRQAAGQARRPPRSLLSLSLSHSLSLSLSLLFYFCTRREQRGKYFAQFGSAREVCLNGER